MADSYSEEWPFEGPGPFSLCALCWLCGAFLLNSQVGGVRGGGGDPDGGLVVGGSFMAVPVCHHRYIGEVYRGGYKA